MYMNKFIVGAIVGGGIGAVCAAYTTASAQQKKQFAKLGKKMSGML